MVSIQEQPKIKCAIVFTCKIRRKFKFTYRHFFFAKIAFERKDNLISRMNSDQR